MYLDGVGEMSCIVIVDDQGTSRRVMSKLASTIEIDAAVVEFEYPLEALSFFRENTPDLVITDYSMPVINGAEFVRRFRDMPECYDVPIVVVTAYTNPEFRRLALEAGTTEYLSLPLDFEEFRLRSRNLLALRNSRRLASQIPGCVSPEEVYTGTLKDSRARAELLDGLLQTLSHKLIGKIEQLDLVCGDLMALLEVSPCAAVFVDSDLRVRRFTNVAANLLDLGDDDIGRRLPLTSSCLVRTDLSTDLAIAKEQNKTMEKFVEDPAGRFYRIRIIPTPHRNDALWGAVISFDRMHVAEPGLA